MREFGMIGTHWKIEQVDRGYIYSFQVSNNNVRILLMPSKVIHH